MKTIHDYLRERLYAQAGVFEKKDILAYSLAQIYQMQWSNAFEQAMRNRMAMGFFRYGALPSQIGKCKYDNVASAKRRLQLYLQDGNMEHLVDVANLCLVEFVVHPEKKFSPTDDGEHTKQLTKD
jgi:hypothetical protein